MPTNEVKPLYVRLPEPLLRKLKVHAVTQGKTLQHVVVELIRAHIPDLPSTEHADSKPGRSSK